MFSRASSGGSSEGDELALQVNWYANANTLTLYTNSSNYGATKFGVSVPYVANGFGRNGESPGPGFCYTNCGHTNVQQGTLEQWLWIR